jgi:hypothetical protein
VPLASVVLPPPLGTPIGLSPFAPGPQVELKSSVIALGDMSSIATTPITIQAGVAGSGKLIVPFSWQLIQQLAADTFVVNPLLRVGYTGKIAQAFNDVQASNAANRFFIVDAGARSNYNFGAGVEGRGLSLIIWGSADATYTGPAKGTFLAVVQFAIVKAN